MEDFFLHGNSHFDLPSITSAKILNVLGVIKIIGEV